MFIEDESDMSARFLELLKEIIKGLGKRNFHNLLESERLQLRFPMALSLKLKCFTKRDNIVYIISRLTTDRHTRMRWYHQKFTDFIDSIVQRDELYIHSWCHDRVSSRLTEREEILDLATLVGLYGSALMRHIDKCIELLFCDLCLTMKIDLPTEYPPESTHEKFHKPCEWQTYNRKYLVYRCYLQSDSIRKTYSYDLRCNLTEKEDNEKGKYIDDRRR